MAIAAPAAAVADRSPLWRVLHRRIFVVPFLAEAQSILGDQLARVAIAVIVLRATGSTPATAAVYAATFLPGIFGGFLLARVGDRIDRRWVLVACDVFRAACFGVIAVRPHDIAVMVVLVVAAMSVGPVFTAAQLSMLAAHVDVDEFTGGNAVRLVASQAAQVSGFVVGGVLVTWLEPRAALAINALTFLVSAVLIAVALPSRAALGPAAPDSARAAELATAGRHRDDLRGIGLWHGRGVRPLVVMSLCIGFFVVPEGLAVPFADAIGADAAPAGVLLGAGALGGAIGAGVLMRLSTPYRARAAAAMSVLCGLPLVLSFVLVRWQLSWWLVAACWLLSGVAAAYVVQTTSAVMHALPERLRSREVGRLSALLLGAQGLAVVAFGGLAAWVGPAEAVGIAGAIGTAIAASALLASRSERGELSRHSHEMP